MLESLRPGAHSVADAAYGMPIMSFAGFQPSFRPARRHLDLGDGFFDPVTPARFPATILRYRNQRWAERMGLGGLSEAEWITHFGRFEPLPGSLPHPVALRYHGHQFRVYNPDLGDGRGFLFAQAIDPVDGRLRDFGTKGSGQTPYSRQGDGRLTLKGGVREVLATALLEALGVETSKSFSLIETGEALTRHDEPSPTRSAVLVRLSHSHLRIGTFQRLAYLGETEALGRLIDYCLAVYYPAPDTERGPPALDLFRQVVAATARTMAQWMAAGFVHGVLNTDNICITGESFDYGPYRFLPHYDPGFTAAYFDETGLYAYGRQPATLQWNLARLAECLLPLADRGALTEVLGAFSDQFEAALRDAMLRRLGLEPGDLAADLGFIAAWFGFLHDSRAPFEQAFFDWYGGSVSEARAAASPMAALYETTEFTPVRDGILARQPRSAAAAALPQPYFAAARPVTLLWDEIEALWAPIASDDDWSSFETKLTAIETARQAYAGASGL